MIRRVLLPLFLLASIGGIASAGSQEQEAFCKMEEPLKIATNANSSAANLQTNPVRRDELNKVVHDLFSKGYKQRADFFGAEWISDGTRIGQFTRPFFSGFTGKVSDLRGGSGNYYLDVMIKCPNVGIIFRTTITQNPHQSFDSDLTMLRSSLSTINNADEVTLNGSVVAVPMDVSSNFYMVKITNLIKQ
jgi:hypothetical protein